MCYDLTNKPVQCVDPCLEKSDVASLLALSGVSTGITNLRAETDGNEWGFDLWNSSPTVMGSFNSSGLGVSSNGDPDDWSPNLRWDATDGYWIGSVHTHPNQTAFSPHDVYYLDSVYTNIMSSKSAAEKAFFMQNATVVCLTNSAIYTAKVKDWDALHSLAADYAANKSYYDNKYNTDKLNTSAGGSEFAFLNQVGTAVNLYKASGSVTAQPEAITGSGTSAAVSTTSCP
jgi:hypothetical protein